jgi:transposase
MWKLSKNSLKKDSQDNSKKKQDEKDPPNKRKLNIAFLIYSKNKSRAAHQKISRKLLKSVYRDHTLINAMLPKIAELIIGKTPPYPDKIKRL